MCVCDGRSNDRLNEWTVQTTEKLADMIQPYDSQTNKNVFLYWLKQHFTTSNSMSYYFECIVCTRFVSPHSLAQFGHLSSISGYDKLAAVCLFVCGLVISTFF